MRRMDETTNRRDGNDAALDRNVHLVAKLEYAERLNRSRLERVSDALGRWAGNPAFALTHIIAFTAWITYNLTTPDPFDPFPFNMLGTLVSLEAIVLTSFVLAAQDLMNKEADRRAKLNLQIDMLAEQELTAILRSIAALAENAGVDLSAKVPDFHSLTTDTRVDRLAKSLEESETLIAEGNVAQPEPEVT